MVPKLHPRGLICSSISAIRCRTAGSRSPSRAVRRIDSAIAVTAAELTGSGRLETADCIARFITSMASGEKAALGKSRMGSRSHQTALRYHNEQTPIWFAGGNATFRRYQLFHDFRNHPLQPPLCCQYELQRERCKANGSGSAAIRGGTVIHPLQLASAMLVIVFATSLFAGTQFFSQQQFGKQRARSAIQLAALPM